MLFLDKSKIVDDTFSGSPLNLEQLRRANPNISIPNLTMKDIANLEKVAEELGYDVVPPTKLEDIVDLVGDSFKEKKLRVTSCKKENGKWVRVFTPEKTHGKALLQYRDALRVRRNSMLKATDWTQMPDAPLSDKKKAEWKTYRQALRDLPKKYDHPVFCKYPSVPKGDE